MGRFWISIFLLPVFGNFLFASPFFGGRAYEYTRAILSFGPRSPMDKGHRQVEYFLRETLENQGINVQSVSFLTKTPMGEKRITNYLGRLFYASGAPTIVFMAHYDSKFFAQNRFLGANDAASSVGLLLAMAEFYVKSKPRVNLEFVFLDAEESLKSWSKEDSLYGSRHLSELWDKQGRQKEIDAMILLDMVGVYDPIFCREVGYSDPILVQELWGIAKKEGLGAMFSSDCTSFIEDDHVPFAQKGFSIVDIIPYPFPSYWHREDDTLDKVSVESLEKVGRVLSSYVSKKEKKA